MSPRNFPRNNQLREHIANGAARLIVDQGIRDYHVAKRKAAQQLGATGAGQLPGNDEIEQAVHTYQRLFRSDSQPQRLAQLRGVAIRAMQFLSRFDACLVGPVLRGTADQYSEVNLHLFSEPFEEVGLFLLEHTIPYQLGERRFRLSAEEFRSYPTYAFVAEDVPVELVVFPFRDRRHPPLSPIDGRPMRRATLAHVEAMAESFE